MNATVPALVVSGSKINPMKRSLFVLFAAIAIIISCKKDTVNDHYTFFRPVYSTKEAVKSNIKCTAPQAIINPGKIVVRGSYIFLNDVDKGIHVIDNSNPSLPKTIAFIQVPGCVDLALNGNYLYADCYTDMVTMDITDPSNVVVKQFLNGVFPERYYTDFVADTSKVIVQWVRVDTIVKRSFGNLAEALGFFGNVLFANFAPAASFTSASTAGTGIAGSLSRFAQINSRLYAVSNSDLKIFNTTNAGAPTYVKLLPMPNGLIETIFPSGNNLFIGTQSGMLVFDAQNPDQPTQTGQFSHTRTCDPVIADSNFAYETLRSNGSSCAGYTNELDIIDISNLSAPSPVSIYPLKSPDGLSKEGNLLFICDGTDGLKVFDAGNPRAITLIGKVPGFTANDVIVQNGIAVVVANEGLYTISYADKNNIQLLGKLPVSQTK